MGLEELLRASAGAAEGCSGEASSDRQHVALSVVPRNGGKEHSRQDDCGTIPRLIAARPTLGTSERVKARPFAACGS